MKKSKTAIVVVVLVTVVGVVARVAYTAASSLVTEINTARSDPDAFRARSDAITMPEGIPAAPALIVNAQLTASATFKAKEIAAHGYFNHQSPITGVWPNELARAHGFNLPEWMADDANNIESLHSGSDDPFLVLVSFANSPTHRRHIFGEAGFGSHRYIGVGRSGSVWVVHTAPAPVVVPAPTTTTTTAPPASHAHLAPPVTTPTPTPTPMTPAAHHDCSL